MCEMPGEGGAPGLRRWSVTQGARDLVVVADAAGAGIGLDLPADLVAAVPPGGGAAVPVGPLTDTVKEVDADGWVVATPDRAGFVVARFPIVMSVEAEAAMLGSGAAPMPGSEGDSVVRQSDPGVLVARLVAAGVVVVPVRG